MISDLFNLLFDLKGIELVLWCIALLFSVLFVIQTIISLFIGGDGDIDDSGSDGHGDAFQFFTIRNMIIFFTMFGWSGLAAYNAGLGNAATIIIGLFAGIAMIAILYVFMRNANKLRNSGTLQMKNTVDQIGETYLRIPAKRTGTGKIHVQVQGRLMELDAMTDDNEDIATGKPIQVVRTLNNSIVLVTTELN